MKRKILKALSVFMAAAIIATSVNVNAFAVGNIADQNSRDIETRIEENIINDDASETEVDKHHNEADEKLNEVDKNHNEELDDIEKNDFDSEEKNNDDIDSSEENHDVIDGENAAYMMDKESDEVQVVESDEAQVAEPDEVVVGDDEPTNVREESLLPVSGEEISKLASNPSQNGKIEWSIDENGKLKVKGTGALGKYDASKPWLKYSDYITSAVIEVSDTSSLHDYFMGCTNLVEVDFSGSDTQYVTDFSGLFYYCRNLQKPGVSGFNTSNATAMDAMFLGCSYLRELDLSNFDTSKVTNMEEMFYACESLKELNISSFDTSNVTNMKSMFNTCTFLKKLDLNHFDTSNVTDMSFMFFGCYSLEDLAISEWDTSNVVNMCLMFERCYLLKKLDVREWNTSNVTDMLAMFRECYNLQELDVSKWDTSNVTKMTNMFRECYNLQELDVSKWKTPNLTSIAMMFYKCRKLAKLDLSNFDTSKINEMNSLFEECEGLKELNVSSFDTSNVTSMERMFFDCYSLQTLDVSSFNTENVENIHEMFAQSEKIEKLDMSSFSLPKVEHEVEDEFKYVRAEKIKSPKNLKGNIKLQVYHAGDIYCWFDHNYDIVTKMAGNQSESHEYNYALKVEVTFDPGEGSFEELGAGYKAVEASNKATKIYPYNLKYMMLPECRLGDMVFDGWYTDNGDKVTVESLLTSSEPIILTARYVKKYTVTFDANGGDVSVSSNTVIYGDKYGELPVAQKDKYRFLGWYTDKEAGTQITADSIVNIDADQTLYAHWKINEYTVTFDANGGDVSVSSNTVIYGDKYGELPVAQKDNYTFLGWYTDKEAGVQITADSIVKLDTDQTLYAHWKINEYTVTFDANGGSADVASIKVISGQVYGKLPVAARKGFVFEGWYTEKNGGERITENSIYNLDTDSTLYAHWANINLAVKQKYDISGYFPGLTGKYKYVVTMEDTGKKAKARVTKRGVFSATKPGKMVITPYIKEGKKYVPAKDMQPLVIVVKKPVVQKSIKDKQLNDKFNLFDYLSELPENSNNVKFSVKNEKVVKVDPVTGDMIVTGYGKAKITIIITNDQADKTKGSSVKLYTTVTIKKPKK